jgi:hypothetical protein
MIGRVPRRVHGLDLELVRPQVITVIKDFVRRETRVLVLAAS